MRFSNSIAALSAVVSLSHAAATTSTVTFAFPPVAEPSDLALSVVTAAPSSTVYAVACKTGSNGAPANTSCPFTSGLVPWVTIAPTQINFNISLAGENNLFKCPLTSTSSGYCNTVIESKVSGKMTTTTQTDDTHSGAFYYGVATITAGLDKLQGSGAATTSPASGSTSASSGSTSASSSSTSSGNGAARETGAMGLLAVVGLAGAGMLI